MNARLRRHTAAVIGCNGFIGAHVAAMLEQAGVGVARFGRADPLLAAGGGPAAALAQAAVIYYLAASITPATAEVHPECAQADRQTFLGLLDALARTPASPVLVLASSGGLVYDAAAAPPYPEDAALDPASAYGRAKLQLERDLLGAGGDLIPVIARMSNVYGPGQRTGRGQGVVAHWLEALRDGRALQFIGDPGALRDYVFAADVAEAMLAVYRLAMRARPLPAVVNLGSGEPTSLERLQAVLCSVTGCDPKVEYAPARDFDRRDVWLDVGLAARTLGWRARTSLADGLARTWAAAPDRG